MPEYLSPGVYIQEVDSGPRPIEGVGTAMAAFVGFAPYSKYKDINRPVLITSWTQYVEAFGLPDENGRKNPHMKDAYLSYAVQGYFQNGGGRCYVTRVVPNGFTRKVESLRLAAAQSPTMPLLEITTNATDKDTFIAIEPAGDGKPEGTFTLKVRLDGDEDWDVYPDLSLAPEKGPTA